MYTYIIYQDDKEIKKFQDQETDLNAFKFMQQIQGQSISYAIKHSGYKIKEIDQETGESEFWEA